MNRTTRKPLDRTTWMVALALAIPLTLLAATAGAQFANDGARQNADGGWDMPYDVCSKDADYAALYTTQPTCETADATWMDGVCRLNRYQCQRIILSHAGAPDPDYDSSLECTDEPGGQHQWVANACTTGEDYRNSATAGTPQQQCINNGGTWLSDVCRGRSYYPAAYGFPTDSAAVNYRDDCARCHNLLHYPPGEHGQERAVAESFVMTGHKNMARPLAPDTLDPHYLVGGDWAGSNGVTYPSDGTNPINFANGTITVGAFVKDLYWIYDGWIADYPRALYDNGFKDVCEKPDGTLDATKTTQLACETAGYTWRAVADGNGAANASYSCGRCHTTGWTSDAAINAGKFPEKMFPGITWDGAYTGQNGNVNLAGGVSGDPNKYSSWDQWGIQCSRCHGSQNFDPAPAGGGDDLRHHPNLAGKAATGASSTGATRVALCMDCHRAETGGKPYADGLPAAAGDEATAHPGQFLKVGPYHESVEFLSHWHGNLFLNSPHGQFSGTFAQLNDKTKYDTHFKNEGESYPYQSNAGGCTQCHNVHKSTVDAANPAGGAIHEECTECHDKSLGAIMHPTGVGTPIESKVYPNEACEACHMPEGLHLFRINVDETYSTFPDAALDGAANANTTADGAVWVDIDHACGQCHGGGTAQVFTTGTIAKSSNVLTVASKAGLERGQRIEITGAAAGGAVFHTYVKTVNPDPAMTVVLAGKAGTAVTTPTEVVQNPVKNGAGYMDKATLAALAEGMHADKPEVYFSWRLGTPNTLQVNVDASMSTCSGSAANCNAYSWVWGDGTCDAGAFYTLAACTTAGGVFTPSDNGSGLTASHIYPAAGTYSITLTVTQYSVGSASRTSNVTVYAPDAPPVVNGTCGLTDPNNWIATVTDAPPATDDQGIAQYYVNWGDGSVISNDKVAPFGPFTHTFIKAGTFTITRKVIDSIGQQAIDASCVVTVAPFSVGGTVFQSNGTTGVAGATVTVKKGIVIVKTAITAANGTYTVTGLKPGTYQVFAKKLGYTFPVVGASVTVGPNGTANVQALAP